MKEPTWSNIHYPKIHFQAISYYAEPKLKSMDEVDPELLCIFEKLGVPQHERMALAGVAVDVIFGGVSVATIYKKKLAEVGLIFCSMSEAVLETRSWCESTSARWCRPVSSTLIARITSDGSRYSPVCTTFRRALNARFRHGTRCTPSSIRLPVPRPR
jgi:Fe-S cluster assembly scaffold protein SufB